jgi:hypothetical protein
MDADVGIHCTFPDICIFPGGTFVERQGEAYLIPENLPGSMLAMQANMQEPEILQQLFNFFNEVKQ